MREVNNIVITGSEGYIGRVLCERLPNALRIDAKLGHDICGDIPPLGDCTLIHLAAISTHAACREKPYEASLVNIVGTKKLMMDASKCKQIIFASTEWVHDKRFGLYASTKMIGEQIVRDSGVKNVTVLRFGIACGRGSQSAPDTLQSGAIGSRKTARRFIHVEDLCDGIVAAIGLEGHHTLDLTGNRLITLGEIADAKGLTVTETDPDNPSIRDVDNTKAKEVLKWNPHRSVLDNLR